MITVKLVWQQSGKPASGKRVGLGFSGFGRGVTHGEWTDSNGEAHFDSDPGDGVVFLNGGSIHRGYLSGRVVVYI